MDIRHPFASAFLALQPDRKDLLPRIKRNGGKHILVDGIDGYSADNITIGNAETERQEQEGELFALCLDNLAKRLPENLAFLRGATEMLSGALDREGIDLHSMRVQSMAPARDLVLPTIEFEVTELDHGLIGRIVKRHFRPDAPGASAGEPWVGKEGALAAWAERQGRLRRMRADTGILIDPLMAALLRPAQRQDLVRRLQNEASSGSPSFEATSPELDRSIAGYSLKDGMVRANIRLAEGIYWNTLPFDRGPGVLLSQHVPGAMVMAMEGRRLREIIDHPLIDPAWTVVRTGTEMQPPSLRRIMLETECAFLPLEAAPRSLS